LSCLDSLCRFLLAGQCYSAISLFSYYYYYYYYYYYFGIIHFSGWTTDSVLFGILFLS
jgi:hypothetical protein